MPPRKLQASENWTAADLRRLPPHERDAILTAAAELAEEDYRSDPQLTAFDAFGEKDLHANGPDTDSAPR